MDSAQQTKRPGIEGIEVYFPGQYVSQEQLEIYDKVAKGKYTRGLGQLEMCFCTDLESAHTLAMTSVANLMKKKNISYKDIGRLSVSTETILDKSKSIKSALMTLFEESGNHDVEGVDYINACYGGTAALFDAVSWVESRDWDGRYALVVTVDIAEYAPGPARPTGGAGAVAMLIGPNPVLTLEVGRSSFMKHAYDFYKPFMSSPYPVVDGALSNKCYLEALDNCYQNFAKLRKKRYNKETSLDDFNFICFHSPYNKLVKKSMGRLLYNDFLLHTDKKEYSEFQEFLKVETEASYTDRKLYKTFDKASDPIYKEKVGPSTFLPKRTGNSYTASLYMSIASLIEQKEAKDLLGKSVLCFSYGSGLCSSLFQLTVSKNLKAVQAFKKQSDYTHRLKERTEATPKQFNNILEHKLALKENEEQKPKLVGNLYPGTYHVEKRTNDGKYLFSLFKNAMKNIENCNNL